MEKRKKNEGTSTSIIEDLVHPSLFFLLLQVPVTNVVAVCCVDVNHALGGLFYS